MIFLRIVNWKEVCQSLKRMKSRALSHIPIKCKSITNEKKNKQVIESSFRECKTHSRNVRIYLQLYNIFKITYLWFYDILILHTANIFTICFVKSLIFFNFSFSFFFSFILVYGIDCVEFND